LAVAFTAGLWLLADRFLGLSEGRTMGAVLVPAPAPQPGQPFMGKVTWPREQCEPDLGDG
jgi:hypothetical protein